MSLVLQGERRLRLTLSLLHQCCPINITDQVCAVCSGMTDLFEMLQSRTFVQQFGYGLLKVLLVNLFPELKLLFKKIERGAVEQTSSGSKAAPKAGGGQAGSGSKAASKTAAKAAASAANSRAEPPILNPPVPPNGMKRGAGKVAPAL